MSLLPCSVDSQLPTLTPSRFAPFIRRMPAARSGLRRLQSEASYANRGTAARRKLIVAGGVSPLLQGYSVPGHNGSIERQPWLRTVPVDEISMA